MNSEIIQSVACDNYDDFQHVNFIFWQNFISLFWELYNDETDLRVSIGNNIEYFVFELLPNQCSTFRL
jgi:hypothetical protein